MFGQKSKTADDELVRVGAMGGREDPDAVRQNFTAIAGPTQLFDVFGRVRNDDVGASRLLTAMSL